MSNLSRISQSVQPTSTVRNKRSVWVVQQLLDDTRSSVDTIYRQFSQSSNLLLPVRRRPTPTRQQANGASLGGNLGYAGPALKISGSVCTRVAGNFIPLII